MAAMLESKRNFHPEDVYFIIDSENLTSVGTQLYGYTITDDVVTDDIQDLHGRDPEPEGAFVYVRRDENRITVRQDNNGSYSIFRFEENGYFAFSNSFLTLLEHLRGKYRLTLNREFADYMLAADLCSFAYGETMVNEIDILERGAVLEIAIPEKKYEIRLTDFRENTVEPDTEEGLAILDSWHDKWVRRIRNIAAYSHSIRADLSGGFDSRETMSLLISSGIDLNRILIHSKQGTVHTYAEDYRIASAIAEKYGFRLNNRSQVNDGKENFSLEDMMEIVFRARLCFHKEFYYSAGRFTERRYVFNGFGGGCIRRLNNWGDSIEDYVQDAVKRVEVFSDVPEAVANRLKTATEHVIRRSFERLRKRYEALGRPFPKDELSQSHYRETRGRAHFGTIAAMQYPANVIQLAPLMDPDIQRLKISSGRCRDTYLLSAILLGRYVPGLLDFEFQGNRSISPETVAYVRELNRRHPYRSVSGEKRAITVPHEKPVHTEPLEPTGVSKADRLVRNAFLSPQFRHIFESVYDETIYEEIRKDSMKRRYFPLSMVFVPVGIVKVLQDISVYETLHTSYIHFLAEQPEQPGADFVPPTPPPEPNFTGKVKRRLKKTAHVLLHGDKE